MTTEFRFSTSKGEIVVVDDTPANLQFLSRMLSQTGYTVRPAPSGELALRAIQAKPPDLILLDIRMPEMNGYEVCQALKANTMTQEIPVIFISALDEVFDKVKAFSVGGVDYITKPFQMEEVLIRVQNHLLLRAAKVAVETVNLELEQRVQQRTSELEREIIERRRVQDQLLHMATHDALTGLPNRTPLMDRLEQALNRARLENSVFAILFLDCDRFKVVNDSLGHLIGDQLLVLIARRLKSCLRLIDTLARLGGDEFTILLEGIKGIEDAIQIATRIHTELTQPFRINEQEIFITTSIGIVLGNAAYHHPIDLLRDADTAMYQAKQLGSGRHEVFDPSMHANARTRLRLETDLRYALERQEFLLYYQPIVSLNSGELIGFEALTRWQHPERGLISPVEFIPVAEETGLILPLGTWVLRQACQQLQIWKIQGLVQAGFTVSVNLSVKQFSQPDLIHQIDQILQESGMDSCHLKLEITESAIMHNADSAAEILHELRSRQIQLSIDDFGTGYSSLSYLHRFPVDTLKVDQSFTLRIGQPDENPGIIQAIVSLARTLGMEVIAEGVETPEQLEYLKTLGCDYGQGYFFSKPVDAEVTAARLMEIHPT